MKIQETSRKGCFLKSLLTKNEIRGSISSYKFFCKIIMILSNFAKVLRRNWKYLFNIPLLVASLAFLASTLIIPQYETKVSILVIQKQPEDKVDAFSAAKSAEYLSDIFSKIIFTDSFIDDVLVSSIKIKDQYSSNKEERKKEWGKKVKVRKVNNTGIIEISVYDSSSQESQKIAQVISLNLSSNNSKYHGGGDKISVNLIDGPILSKNPLPNIWLNLIFGFLIGFVGFLGYIYYKNKDFIEGKNDYPLNSR